MRKLLFTMLSLLLLSAQLIAQNRSISGRITDDKGVGLPNASVTVKGTNIGTTTNSEGIFTLSVAQGAKTLTISSVGFESQEVSLGNRASFDIQLTSNSAALENVVVVGYQTRRKRDEGGAISSVQGRQIENTPNVSVDRALQGRAAGVQVLASNGIPGGGINVKIRGTATFTGSTQPLYVVDGVQLNTRDDAGFTQTNPLAFLNPNDIESIDILKDAASAAIYGAQASNGVVIITTKRGRAGKTRFNLNSYVGTSELLRKYDVLGTKDWVQARAEADWARWAPQTPGYRFLDSRQWALGELSAATGLTYATIVARGYGDKQIDSIITTLPNNDWQDLAFQKGTIQNYDLSMSGGNDKTTFYIGAGYTYQSTIINKVDFKRYALNANITHRATDRLTVNTKLNLSTFNQNVPFAVNGSFLGNPAFSASTILSVNPLRNPDGTYFGLPPGQALAGVLNQNIIAVNEFNSGNNRTNQLVGALTLDYKIADWLSFRSFASLDYRLVQGKNYRDPRTNDGFGVRGRGSVESNWNTNFLTTQTLNFNKDFNDFRFDGVLGYEYRNDVQQGLSAGAIGFPSYQFVTLNSAATPETVSEFWTGYRRSSAFARANLGYQSKYILSLIGRRDGSSRFGTNNPFGNFFGIIGSWNIDKENFIKRADWVSTLRLRASWGQTGLDQIGNFAARSLYVSGAQYGGTAGINYGGLPNPDLEWERNQTINVGIDYGFFRNRINGSVELYERKGKNALLPQQVGWVNGTGSYQANVGEITVKGVEVSVNADIVRPRNTDGFRWNTNLTFTYQYNTVSELYSGNSVLPGDPSVRVGRSIGSVFTQVYKGVNPATGRPMFLDTFGKVTYQPQARDRRYIGDTEPDYLGGLTNTFSWKGFTMEALFVYEFGRLATDGQYNFLLENGNRLINGLQEAFDKRWQKPGDITSYPRIFDTGTEPGGVNHVTGSSRLWTKADFIRLRELRISYDLPSSLVRRLKLNSARFYVQGQNLWTKTEWWGYDPEFTGVATGIIPQTKNYNVGVQIGF